MNVLKEEEIPFKEAIFENVYFIRETFHSLASNTFYSLYLYFFDGLIIQEVTHDPIQINYASPNL